jgi:4a-hydroxytetrahydrobiopterin dehydratase
MSHLAERSCTPCHGGVPPLGPAAAHAFLACLDPFWSVSDDGTALVRTVALPNFHEVMAFVNAVAWIAHQEDHHPDMLVGFASVELRYTTHACGGLTENDFICAARVDRLLRG